MRAARTLSQAFPAYRLRAITGEIELAIAEVTASTRPRAVRVTRVLAAGLETVDGVAVTEDVARSLSSGSRVWLMQQLAAAFRKSDDWFEGRCTACEAVYDIGFDLATLPVKQPAAAFPVIEVETSAGPRLFESPNGFHEEALAQGDARPDPRRRLAELTGLAADAERFAQAATAEDLDRIDAMLEAGAPEASEESACECPACGTVTTARIDPLSFSFPRENDLVGEIHRMASAYHWREEDILALPSIRRRRYLDLIDASHRPAERRP